MDETDYFQKRDKFKEKIVDDEWDALKKIKNKQEKTIKSKPENSDKKPDNNKTQP
ncbi:MAG: hypothetical protein ACQ9MH_03650 [Nitrospinales bacterium]